MSTTLSLIRGCIFGGAVGDALGYPVEFFSEESIFRRYGARGITAYEKDPATGKALISDDTQMSLFTANGLLVGETRGRMRGIQAAPRAYVEMAYQDWLLTQDRTFEEVQRFERPAREGGISWLLDVPELFAWRAPGNTCLSALREGRQYEDYVAAARNQSKGCGGIMRVAPLAAKYHFPKIAELDREGAQLAAITHGHSLGYMPAAVLVHVLNRLIFPPVDRTMTLLEIIREARDTAAEIFKGDVHLPELLGIIDLAVTLSQNGLPDLQNIHQLGEGWVAEETLGIALYCALRHQDDFSAGIIAAVNHKGDSDSTGAVTGNILGALLGYEAIADQWKADLELSDVILEIADDLANGCQMSEYGDYRDPVWDRKYIQMRRPKMEKHYVFFWHEYEEYGYLSNWYPCKFVVADLEYLFVEQYMMAQKAKLFHDAQSYTAILRASDPQVCKDLGRQVKGFDSDVWDKVCYDVVKAGNRAKFAQNKALRDALLATGDAILAEAAPNDKKWGIGMTAEVAEKTPQADWNGKNLLGKVLMELREEFRRGEA